MINPSENRLRRGDAADLPAVNDIVTHCVMAWNLPERVKRLSLASYLYQPHDLQFLQLWLAVDTSGLILGVAALEPAEASELPAHCQGLLLHGIYVAPAQQRTGIGIALLNKALGVAAAQRLDGLLVKAQSNAATYFRRLGFTELPVSQQQRDYPHRYWKAVTPG